MEHVPWTPDLTLGIPLIDSDHRVLVRLLNQTIDGLDAYEETVVLGSIIDALYAYTKYHFRREITLQKLCGYPDVGEHALEHKELALSIAQIRDRFYFDPDSVQLAEVHSFLTGWLIEHIMVHDRSFAPYCEGKDEESEKVCNIKITDGCCSSSHDVDWEKLRVVVVEDNKFTSKLLRTLLDVAGVRHIRMAKNADDAVDRIKDFETDLVISDYMMDGASGLEVSRDIFRIDPRTRMLFLSGLDLNTLKDKGKSAGADAVLEKPFTAHSLYSAISLAIAGAVRPGVTQLKDVV